MRFTPSFYDDPRGALFKLMQHDSFNAYLSEFKALANRTMGLPPPFLLSCFIFELSLDILCEVQALPPLSLVQAAALAKLQEDKLFYARHGLRFWLPVSPITVSPFSSLPLS